MLFSRMMSAKNVTVARRAGFLGALGIVLTAFVIVMIGVEARAFLPPETSPDNILTGLVQTLSPTTQVVFLLVMLSTILSSADSCLVTAATVASRDFLGSKIVRLTRYAVFVFGFAALLLGTTGHSIWGLLLMVNVVYVCAVVPPAFVALISPMPIHRTRLLMTIICATVLAIAGEVTDHTPGLRSLGVVDRWNPMEHCANQTPGTSRLTFNQDPHKLMAVPERYQTPGDSHFLVKSNVLF